MPHFRKPLPHVPPGFVRGGSWFFITMCCGHRSHNELCRAGVSESLMADALFYHRRGHWHLHLFLLMPDHLHMIAAFPRELHLSEVVRNWKRLTTRRTGVCWQKNYFDHRIRPGESLQIKTNYIRQNPVRAGLAAREDEWPYFLDPLTLEGR